MNMSDAITLNYYNSNAAVFSETTKNVDFSEVQQIFTKHLSPDASILDFGCGSGRDTKYFLNNGYHVTATDGSGVICKMAKYISQNASSIKNEWHYLYIVQIRYI